MGMRCTTFSVVFAALILCSVPRGSGGPDGFRSLSHGSNLAPLSELEEEMVEHILLVCGFDFFGIRSVSRVVSSHISDDNVGSNKLDIIELLLLKCDLQESISYLPAQLKYSLIDCLISQNVVLSIFQRFGSTNSYVKSISTIIDQDPVIRKYLAHQIVSRNFPSSSFLTSSLPRRRAQESEAPSAALDGTALQPSEAPTPVPGGHIGPRVINLTPVNSITPSEHNNSNTKAIVIAVVVTATVTLTLSALCFWCFYRYLKGKYQFGNEQRDERPLLSSSLNDFSGSSHVTLGNNGALSFKIDPNLSSQITPNDSLASLTDPNGAHRLAPSPSLSPPLPFRRPPENMFFSPTPLLTPKPPPIPPSPALPKTDPTLPIVRPLPPNDGPLPPKGGPPPPKGGPPPPKGGPPPPKGGPPPPKGGPPPPKGGPPPPKGPPRPPQANSSSSTVPLTSNISENGSKAKLKPFFWDKVMTSPDQSMVWHQIKSGSFQFNEEMIETLFGYNATDKRWSEAKQDLAKDASRNYIQFLDPKKAQNLAISLKARNVTVEEVCDALMEGNELPIELLQILLRLAPSADEEQKLRLFNGNTALLGPAEQFLKSILNIPFAFKRMDALLLMAILQEESTYVKESLATLEEACKELRNSRLFLKLLEAVLKTGNRMNDGTYRGRAQAFKLDTLLKLSDVKGTDGKTTLLQFVVQEIIMSEGKRAVRVARETTSDSNVSISSHNFEEVTSQESEDQFRSLGLQIVSGLKNELDNVKNAAGIDAEGLTVTVVNLNNRLMKTKGFLNNEMRNLEEESSFHESLKAFVEHAEADVTFLFEEEKRVKSLVKNTADYFYGTSGRDEGLRLFSIVRDFLGMLDKTCKEVRDAPKKVTRTYNNEYNPTLHPVLDAQQTLFPAIKDRNGEGFSSDDDGS